MQACIFIQKAASSLTCDVFSCRENDHEGVESTWEALGQFSKQHCNNADMYILSGQSTVTRELRMKADKKWPITMGGIECRLSEFSGQCRELKRFALQILCQKSNASGCEHHWNVLEDISKMGCGKSSSHICKQRLNKLTWMDLGPLALPQDQNTEDEDLNNVV